MNKIQLMEAIISLHTRDRDDYSEIAVAFSKGENINFMEKGWSTGNSKKLRERINFGNELVKLFDEYEQT